jgi:hypothetical protein
MDERLPDTESLEGAISSAMAETGRGGGRVAVLEREASLYWSTFPIEIVTCRIDGRRPLRMLCKYSSDEDGAPYAPRGGPAYEALVYRHLLQWSPLTTPGFYGAYDEPVHGDTWLFLECLDPGARLTKAPDLDATMVRAASWIGRFHALQEGVPGERDASFLLTYDERHYRLDWARNGTSLGREQRDSHPWLPGLLERYEGLAAWMASAPRTVIHGEYYTKNILFRGERIYPVDWESAAVGIGELDLATLVEGWKADVVEAAVNAYRRARWPTGAPESFERMLEAARVYWQLCWLEQGYLYGWRFKQLRAAGKRLGLI